MHCGTGIVVVYFWAVQSPWSLAKYPTAHGVHSLAPAQLYHHTRIPRLRYSSTLFRQCSMPSSMKNKYPKWYWSNQCVLKIVLNSYSLCYIPILEFQRRKIKMRPRVEDRQERQDKCTAQGDGWPSPSSHLYPRSAQQDIVCSPQSLQRYYTHLCIFPWLAHWRKYHTLTRCIIWLAYATHGCCFWWFSLGIPWPEV